MAARKLKKSNSQRWSSGLDVLRRGESNPVRYEIFEIIMLNTNRKLFAIVFATFALEFCSQIQLLCKYMFTADQKNSLDAR